MKPQESIRKFKRCPKRFKQHCKKRKVVCKVCGASFSDSYVTAERKLTNHIGYHYLSGDIIEEK